MNFDICRAFLSALSAAVAHPWRYTRKMKETELVMDCSISRKACLALMVFILFICYASTAMTKPRISENAKGEISPDPLVGTWEMDDRFGSYDFTIIINKDGTCLSMFSGIELPGTWKKLSANKYRVKPCAEDDYVILQGDTYMQFDSEGLIRSFHRVEK